MNLSITVNNRYFQPSFWFMMFCLVHLSIWTLIPSLFYQNLPKNVIEGLAWGNLWLWGYVKHPPLAAWLTAAATHLGGAVGWPIYLLAQIGVLTAFWAIWTLAKKFLAPWHALLAVLLLEGVMYYTWESPNFNPNVLMLPLWSLAILTFYCAISERRIYQWLLLGLLLGLAMLAKYQSLILCFTMLLFLISTSKGRDCFKQLGVYLAVLIALLVFLPNFIYLVQHHFDSITYVGDRLALKTNHSFVVNLFLHPIKFFIAQLVAVAGAFVLLIPFYKQAQTKRAFSEFSDFDKKFLLIIGFFPLLLTLCISFVLNARLVGRWGFPFFSLIGVIWVSWLQPLITVRRLYALAMLLLLFMSISTIGHYLYYDTSSHVADERIGQFFPGREIASFAAERWHQYYGSPLPYAAGDYNTVINIGVYAPNKPIPYLEANLHKSPWVDEARLRDKGSVFVAQVLDEREIKETLSKWKQRFPTLEHPIVKQFPYLTKKTTKPLQLLIAFVPPRS